MQIFCNAAVNVTVETTLVEAPANQEMTVHNLYISNNSDTDVTNIQVKLVKAGTTFANGFFIVSKDLPVDPLNTIELKPINLMSGDKIMISRSGNILVHAVASILKEIKDF